MSRVTSYQRAERTRSPYTIHSPVDTEFGTRVVQLTGVYWDDNGRQQEDLGTHSTPVLAAVAAETWRAAKVAGAAPDA